MKRNLLVLFIFGCKPQQAEKHFEDGAEVITNGIKPCQIEGQSSSLDLESAGYHNSTGNDGTFVGRAAGYNNDANNNTFIGHYAGYNNSSGEGNFFWGTMWDTTRPALVSSISIIPTPALPLFMATSVVT
jgi:hypothetical protein